MKNTLLCLAYLNTNTYNQLNTLLRPATNEGSTDAPRKDGEARKSRSVRTPNVLVLSISACAAVSVLEPTKRLQRNCFVILSSDPTTSRVHPLRCARSNHLVYKQVKSGPFSQVSLTMAESGLTRIIGSAVVCDFDKTACCTSRGTQLLSRASLPLRRVSLTFACVTVLSMPTRMRQTHV